MVKKLTFQATHFVRSVEPCLQVLLLTPFSLETMGINHIAMSSLKSDVAKPLWSTNPLQLIVACKPLRGQDLMSLLSFELEEECSVSRLFVSFLSWLEPSRLEGMSKYPRLCVATYLLRAVVSWLISPDT